MFSLDFIINTYKNKFYKKYVFILKLLPVKFRCIIFDDLDNYCFQIRGKVFITSMYQYLCIEKRGDKYCLTSVDPVKFRLKEYFGQNVVY